MFSSHRVREITEAREYLKVEPSLENTFCEKASYDFIPFDLAEEPFNEPANAVLARQEEPVKVYLGRVSPYCFSSDNHGLCEITPATKSVRTIGVKTFEGKNVKTKSCLVRNF